MHSLTYCHRWCAGVVDDVLDGGRAYEIAWAHEETCNEVPAADVRALAPASNEPSSSQATRQVTRRKGTEVVRAERT